MESKEKSIQILNLKIREVVVPIMGISPLIVHAWSQKSMTEIADKQAGKAKNKKYETRVPEKDFEAAKHKLLDGTDGFPAAGFKAAMIRGAKACGMVMKDVQTAFFIKSDDPEKQLVRINGECRMRTDTVRVGMGSADLRYRPEYPEWSANLRIEFNEGIISLEQIYQIIKIGGWGGGIGEMRPEKTKFEYGRWDLAKNLN